MLIDCEQGCLIGGATGLEAARRCRRTHKEGGKARRLWEECVMPSMMKMRGTIFFVKVDFDVVLWSPEFLQRKTVSVRNEGRARRGGS